MKSTLLLISVFFFQFASAGNLHFQNNINTRNLSTIHTTKNFKPFALSERCYYSTFHVMSKSDFTPKEIYHEFNTQIFEEIYKSNNLNGYIAVWNNSKIKLEPDKKGGIIEIQIVVTAQTDADMPALMDFLKRKNLLVLADEKVDFQPITGILFTPEISVSAGKTIVDEKGKWSVLNTEDSAAPMNKLFSDLNTALRAHDKKSFINLLPNLFYPDAISKAEIVFDQADHITVEADTILLKQKDRTVFPEPGLAAYLAYWPQQTF